jgi:hypothetical protein
MNIGQGQGGTISTATIIDYLRPDINRPDLFEDQSVIVKDVHGPSNEKSQSNQSSKYKNMFYTIMIIIVSAIIFIVAISWTDVLRSWFDTKYVNPIIQEQYLSRLYFAITITIIGLVLLLLLGFLWYYIIT